MIVRLAALLRRPEEWPPGRALEEIEIEVSDDLLGQLETVGLSAQDEGIAAGIDGHVQRLDQGLPLLRRLGTWASGAKCEGASLSEDGGQRLRHRRGVSILQLH